MKENSHGLVSGLPDEQGSKLERLGRQHELLVHDLIHFATLLARREHDSAVKAAIGSDPVEFKLRKRTRHTWLFKHRSDPLHSCQNPLKPTWARGRWRGKRTCRGSAPGSAAACPPPRAAASGRTVRACRTRSAGAGSPSRAGALPTGATPAYKDKYEKYTQCASHKGQGSRAQAHPQVVNLFRVLC